MKKLTTAHNKQNTFSPNFHQHLAANVSLIYRP